MLLSVYSYSCSAQFEHVQSTVTQRPQLTIFSWTLTLYNLLPAFLNVWFKTLVKKVTFSSLSILMACENSNNSNMNQMSIGCGKKPQSYFHPRTLNIYKMPLQSINNFGMNINQVAMVGIFLVNICGKFNSWKPCGDNMFGLECKEIFIQCCQPSQVKLLSSMWWESQPSNVAKKGNQMCLFSSP